MMLGIDEIEKIFDFIIINKNIKVSDYSVFNRNTLIYLRDIIKGVKPNNFVLSRRQQKALISAFLDSNHVFNEYTPSIILSNQECIYASLERNSESVNYLKSLSRELTSKVIDFLLKKKYILTKDSPSFLAGNYIIALNSIRLDVNSANYVSWESMKKDDYNRLINEIINLDYILSSNSCLELRKNPDIVLNSMKKDIKTIEYSHKSARTNLNVFKYLIQNEYKFDEDDLKRYPLSSYADTITFNYAMEKFNSFYDDDSLTNLSGESLHVYIKRYTELFTKAINTPPTIKSLESIFQMCAEFKWDDYKTENANLYANIFGKICTELKNHDDFECAIAKKEYLWKMKEVLDDKYGLLLRVMQKYHIIVHGNNKLGKIDSVRDELARLSALYVSISKEKYKKEQVESCFEEIKKHFIPRKNHPIVYKKLVEHKYKEKIKELYQNDDNNIWNFLRDIVDSYKDVIDSDTVWFMINGFLIDNQSKMDSFIKAPRGWNNYKRYKEACKLINRLNSHYIKYTDMEVMRYLDIIKYNSTDNKYYYEGPIFEDELIKKYDEYRKKLYVFDKVKQQIIFRAKKLEINSEISNKELESIAHDLPFNDEYFEFTGIKNNEFDLDDFLRGCVWKTEHIKSSSILDDGAYRVLTNYVIDNSLLWMLLFLNKYDNNSLYDIGIDKESILASFDIMKKVSKMAKYFGYDINKYEDIVLLCELCGASDEKDIAILGKDVIRKLSEYRDYTDDDVEKIIRIAKELVCEMVKKDRSTIPYVNGKTENYYYSVYDSQDETILLAGINTNACFRVNGTDNDFLHYCALDKNGVVIKITDSFGNFIARAAGFRNGNGVYFNQLRSIYDEGGSGYSGDYENERNEIIETFKKACNDIVETSQKNIYEKDKIDFVFVTKSYVLSQEKSNVSEQVADYIGEDPMDNESEDWKNFVKNTRNLEEVSDDSYFTTDYGNYDLICIACSNQYKGLEIMNLKDIKFKNVLALYERPRNKILVTNSLDINIMNKINKIEAINSYFKGIDFEQIKLSHDAIVFIGDNWYIACNDGVIEKSCVLDFDQKAIIEYKATQRVITEILSNNNQQINVKQIFQQMCNNESSCYKLMLKL